MTPPWTQTTVMEELSFLLPGHGWSVAFTCRPNRPHIGVVPIPTRSGVGRTRYPDLVATDGRSVRLVEVEPRETGAVLTDIRGRFIDHYLALSDPRAYTSWKGAVEQATGVAMPATFEGVFELIFVHGKKPPRYLDLGLKGAPVARVLSWSSYSL